MNNNHKLTFQTALPLFPALWSDSHSFLVNKSFGRLIPCPWAQAVLLAVWHTQTHTQPETDSPSLSVHASTPLWDQKERRERERERERGESERERAHISDDLSPDAPHKTTHTHTHTHTQSLTFVDAITGSQIMLQAMQIVKNYWNKKKEFERKKVGEKWRG